MIIILYKKFSVVKSHGCRDIANHENREKHIIIGQPAERYTLKFNQQECISN